MLLGVELIWWGLAAALLLVFSYIAHARRRAVPHDKARQKVLSSGRITPDVSTDDDDGRESLDVWGFDDTRFQVNQQGHVEVIGSRYELSGNELPNLLPWVRGVMQIPFDPQDRFESEYPTEVPESAADAALIDELRTLLSDGQVTTDAAIRLRHGHGHTQGEMYAIKHGRIERVPDVVVFPESEDQVVRIVKTASARGLCVIPYGGGTNVSDALRCPTTEARTIVSVDMQRMNRVLWIDPVDRTACIEAGAVGRHIAARLAEYGFTMGHEPDSVEFSTLGGWIATRASGMKKNRYGNIEDLMLDVTVVTPLGKLQRSSVAPRESVGADPRRWILGSEGNVGIITRAVVKVFPLPEVQRYGSIVFPSFEHGVAFLHDLVRQNLMPASVRLVDNLQFQFSVALRPRSRGTDALVGKLQKWYVMRLLGYDPERMTACTLVFEGGNDEVKREQRRVYRTGRRHGGLKAGSANGRRGYQLTFGIAYIRDFIMNHHILGESFETSVPWSRLLELCDNVKRRVREEHAARGLPGLPFVSCRVTQLYHSGACVYFYLGCHFKGVDRPSQVFAEIERAAREEILKSGGSLSHHHGIGKLRREFLSAIMSPAALEWSRRTKRAVDPENVFGCGNQQLVS